VRKLQHLERPCRASNATSRAQKGDTTAKAITISTKKGEMNLVRARSFCTLTEADLITKANNLQFSTWGGFGDLGRSICPVARRKLLCCLKQNVLLL